MWRTQIGGKYHRDDNSVFRLKKKLTAVGILVSHPIADEIIATTSDQGFAFDPNELQFAEVERDYYHSIMTSDFHTVCNQFGTQLGYIGHSASLEIAYAMCHNRPILFLHRADFKSTVDSYIRSFVLERLASITIADFLRTSEHEIFEAITELTARPVDYGVSGQARCIVEMRVAEMLRAIDLGPANASP